MPRATVLVADDHAVVAEGLASFLRGEFSLAGTVTDGAQLLEAARRLRPDVIVTDMTMPGLSGLELQRVLAQADDPRPVVFLSGRGDIASSVQAMKAGAVDFLTKPCDEQTLVAAVRAAVEKDRAARETQAERQQKGRREPLQEDFEVAHQKPW